MKRAPAPALLLLPALLLFLVLFVYPQIWMAGTSVEAPNFTLAHYAHFLGDAHYLGTLARSLMLGAWVTLLTVLLGLPLAYWLARWESRVAPILVVLSTFPLWVSAVVRSFAWIVLLGRGGVVGALLQTLGSTDQPPQLLYTMTGVVIALTQVLLPFMVLSLYGVIRSIDPEIERAAQNLGASPFKAVLLTTIPLARHGLLSAALLIFALAISAFATPSLVGGARVQLMSTTIYEQMAELADWQFAAAVSFILLAVVLAISFVQMRIGSPPEESALR
jgi:ABC-type spermidine/putrescine transport system permease subunit I